ncbi:MAG TPA: nucleotidyltransferase family protein [Planctomycetota bacterium]|nr:nucleotidyltransferase family protein [Planctomycetota bacterium]
MAIVPIVLAAGESVRMGRPKPLCLFGNKPALDLVLDACRGAKLAPIVVLGHAADQVRAKADLRGAKVILNPDFAKGQTSSLQAGVKALPKDAEGFLLFPADHPLITADEITPLIAEHKRRRKEKQIFIPSYNLKRGHPVLFDGALRQEILSLPPDAPARTVVNRHPDRIAYVEMNTSAILLDMDTPEDYARCLEEWGRRETTRRRAAEGHA